MKIGGLALVAQTACEVELATPKREGHDRLVAGAFWDGQPWSPTVSRRTEVIAPARQN